MPPFRRRAALASIAAIALLSSGCNYFIMLGYLIGGPPSIEPSFEIETKESLTDHGVTAAVVCFAPTEVRFGFESVDHELAKYVTYRLHSKKIKVINPDRLRAWLDEHRDWDRAEEIAAAFNVDFVIYIDLNRFSLYEEGSVNLYRGRAEAIVSVWKVDKAREESERIFDKEIISKFPLHQPVSTADEPYGTFKSRYLSRLSEEIGRLFYEHFAGDDVHDG